MINTKASRHGTRPIGSGQRLLKAASLAALLWAALPAT